MEKKNIDWGNLGFGYIQTDKRYVSNYKNGAWDEGGLTEEANIVMSECAGVLQYAQTCCEGMKAFRDTIRYAKNAGLIVIADVKRNDIGATATAYSSAYLGRTKIGEEEIPVFDADFATVNGYLGTDGIAPFVEDCRKYEKFVRNG